jgi:hypothetical protein
MDYEELRPLVLQALKQLQKSPMSLQLVNVINVTDQIACERGFVEETKSWGTRGSGLCRMPQEDREKTRQIVWEFILQGVLAIGLNENNPDFPFLSLTEHGKKVLESGETWLPYDPDGYLSKLKVEIPNIDPIIEMYVTESLQAYLKGLMFSSAVMLGVASEKAFLNLLDALINSIKDPKEKSKFERLKDIFKTKYKFDQVKNKIVSIRKLLPRDLSEDLESQFEGIFNIIRITRNDAGHPTGREIERSRAFVNLQLFPFYCQKIYRLIEYLEKNPI